MGSGSGEPQVQSLARGGNATIAYRRSPGGAPGVMFLGGYSSDMTGEKATALEKACQSRGRGFLRFDYQGHGTSSGAFEDGTLGLWIDDALAALDALTEGPQILVGSSMGGWIMLHLALRRPQRVAGLVGIAAAPDFTEDLMWARFSPDLRKTLYRDGILRAPAEKEGDRDDVVTMAMIREARQHLLMRRPIPIHCPVRLLHGMRDPTVPWMTAPRLADRLLGEDVRIFLIKDGDHRLSREKDIAILTDTVDDLAEQVG